PFLISARRVGVQLPLPIAFRSLGRGHNLVAAARPPAQRFAPDARPPAQRFAPRVLLAYQLPPLPRHLAPAGARGKLSPGLGGSSTLTLAHLAARAPVRLVRPLAFAIPPLLIV